MQKLFVIKVGGTVIDDEVRLLKFLKDFALIQEPKILIHGGGKLATSMAEQLNIPQQIIDGRRITDAETLKVIIMVYGGYINKSIVATLQAYGCNAIGLSGSDGNLIKAHKRIHPTIDYGFVGDIDEVNNQLIDQLLKEKMTIVAAPITHDGNGQLLNTNADTIASSIAVAMSRQYEVRLVYCFEKKGVLDDIQNENSVVPLITREIHLELLNSKKISEGILPKIDNAFSAIASGVREVIIGDAEDLLRNISQSPSGTLIKE
ncbi:MAG: acetylglutamate kinase [Bacteroidetes bacterium]|nr:acetylglutamate kinase [Bacteroidota bacterium]